MIKNLIILSLKNLRRHTKRTVITSIAIGFGIAMLIWVDGMLKWADNESKRNLVRYENGNFLVCTKEFKEDRKNFPVDTVISREDVKKLLKIAKETSCFAAPRTGFRSMVSFNRSFGIPYIVYAITPSVDSKVFKIKDSVIEGEYLKDDSDGILISSYCKRELGVGLGDYLTIETRTRYNTYQALNLKVVGIYETPDPVVDRNQLFVTSKLADTDLQTEGTATMVIFKTPTEKNTPYLNKVRELLKKYKLSHLTTITWQEMGADYLTLSKTKKGGSNIIILFIFVIVAVGIVNTMLMAVFERIKEIGMLRALGMRDKYIVWSFIFESAGIGFLGSIIGLIIGIGISAYSVYVGLDFSSAMKDMDIGYRVGTVWYNEWNPEMMITAVIFGVLISMLVSIIPARKAVKMKITDALRVE